MANSILAKKTKESRYFISRNNNNKILFDEFDFEI
jgi:hypothetical protein